MKAFVRGDLDGFIGLGLDNLVQLIILVGLCQGVLHFSPELVYGRMLPAVAVSFLVGNCLYARQALQLAKRTGRDDVCALPYGLNTPTLVAYVFLVMLPARNGAIAAGLPDPDRSAWQVGLVAGLFSGLVEVAIAFVADPIRRYTPRAALLGTLAGLALGFLVMGFLLQGFARPLVGMTTLVIMLVTSFGGVRLPGGVSGILLAVVVGAAFSFLSDWGQAHPPAPVGVGLHLPQFALGELADPAVWRGLVPYLSVVIPMSLLSGLSSLQNIESAEAAGDAYDARSALLVNGAGTLCAAGFGSPFPLTIYIGHPGWKALGARAGYSTLNGLFISALCLTGTTALAAWLIPEDAGLAIVVWVGLVISVQAFAAVPPKHLLAVVIGVLPSLATWLAGGIKAALQAVGKETVTPALVDALHRQNLFLEGAFALEQGFIYTSTVWAAMTVHLLERQWAKAATWSGVGTFLSLLGFIHSWRFVGNDTALVIPLLDWVSGRSPQGWQGWLPAWPFALSYGLVAAILLGLGALDTSGRRKTGA